MEATDTLTQQLTSLLQARHWQLVTAESCTGGLVAAHLTDLPGSSNWFERGFVTYSNAAKIELLGVDAPLIAEQGAVSEQVALAMAEGALHNSQGHIALAVTGIAGPGGGSIQKPVGTVWFAWAAQGMPSKTLHKQYSGPRHAVRAQACIDALQGVLDFILSVGL